MEPFLRHRGIVAPIPQVNVDTDQMVPKQFLKLQTRRGYGRVLFYDWRYLAGEVPNGDFVLDLPAVQGSVGAPRPGKISAVGRAANTHLGRSRTTDSGRFSRLAMQTFFTIIALRMDFSPLPCRTNRSKSFSRGRPTTRVIVLPWTWNGRWSKMSKVLPVRLRSIRFVEIVY